MASTLAANDITILFNDLEGPCDLDRKVSSLRKLIQQVQLENDARADKDYYNQDHDVIRKLIDRWIMWIALDDDALQPLISAFSRELRTEPDAVHALVDHFAFNLKLTPELKRKIIQDKIESTYTSLIKAYHSELVEDQTGINPEPANSNGSSEPKQVDDQADSTLKIDKPNVSRKSAGIDNKARSKVNKELNNLIYRQKAHNLLKNLAVRSTEYEELLRQSDVGKWDAQTLMDNTLSLLFEEERVRRETLVFQMVTSQLAHMSDPRFYGSDEKKYQLVHSLLENHAVPVIVFNLPIHRDLETRWHVGLMLGYVGGRLAIDGLVTALIDEKSTRDARQKTLFEYYLEPAKRQSQQAAQILDTAVKDARYTMLTLRILNICVFFLGLGLIITGVFLATRPGEGWTKFSTGFITAVGGFGAIFYELLRNPLARIQNSIANLVQLETAFTNFIWELNLNGAYIQSQYVSDGKLTDYEISQTVQRMKESMTLTMNQVALYTETGEKRILPRIHSIIPPVGKPDSSVEIHGQNLLSNLTNKKLSNPTNKKDHAGMLTINHIPSHVDGLKWRKNTVQFKLPNQIPGLKESGTIWISLIVDGNETNALPFFVKM